jgi:hypothetical protein
MNRLWLRAGNADEIASPLRLIERSTAPLEDPKEAM